MSTASNRAEAFFREQNAFLPKLKTEIVELIAWGLLFFHSMFRHIETGAVCVVIFVSEPQMGHQRFIDTAARVGSIVQKLEEALLIANTRESEFTSVQRTAPLLQSLQRIRLSLQTIVQRRMNEQIERFRDLQIDVIVLNISEPNRNTTVIVKQQLNKSVNAPR